MSRPIDVVAFLDGVAGASNEIFRLVGSDMQKEAAEARAAVAELMEREAKQRDVLERLCEAYIANRHAMGVHDFVKCVTPAGNRCADSETGRLWLEAAALARCGVAK